MSRYTKILKTYPLFYAVLDHYQNYAIYPSIIMSNIIVLNFTVSKLEVLAC